MNHQIDAIYDNGVFKPLTPLSLPDKAQVKLTIDEQSGTSAAIVPRDEWEQRLLDVARDCGVSLPDSAVSSDALYL